MKRNLVLLSIAALLFSACKQKNELPLPNIINVSPLADMQPIQSNFLGFSHEWGQAQIMIGNSGIGENDIYSQLIENITDITQAPFSIRIGGVSTHTLNKLNAVDFAPFTSLAKKQKVEYIMSVNTAKKDEKLILNQAKEIYYALNNKGLKAIELGSATNTYIHNKFRDSTWGFSKYLDETKSIVDKIHAEVDPSIHFAGPSILGFPKEEWLPKVKPLDFANTKDFAKLHRSMGAAVSIYTFQNYSTLNNKCGGSIKTGALLPADMSRDNPNKIKEFANFAHSKNIALRITELNGVDCGGENNISDAYESALWLIDILFEYAYNGVSGVNIASNLWTKNSTWDLGAAFSFNVPEKQVKIAQTFKAPIGIKYTNNYELKNVAPIYYGMLFFAHASRDGMYVKPMTWDRTNNTKAWFLQNKNNDKRIILINKTDKKVNYTLPEIYANGANMEKLSAPNAAAKNKIKFRGFTFDNSKDGKAIGKEEITKIEAVKVIEIAPFEAVVLSIL